MSTFNKDTLSNRKYFGDDLENKIQFMDIMRQPVLFFKFFAFQFIR